jgi:DNA ligase (NAD+)
MVAGRKGAAEEDTQRFKDQTWVFTGAMSLFTRDAAEEAIRNGGGTASGSVSRNTTFLVVGEKAGSKLVKAKLLGVPVLSEKQFMQVLAGSDPRDLLKAGAAAS